MRRHVRSKSVANACTPTPMSSTTPGATSSSAPASVANGSFIPADWKPRVDGYTTYNYSVTWTGIKDLKLGFGIKNLLDQDPPFTAHMNDFAAGAGWEPRIADPRGRAYTLLVEYKFW